MCGLIRPRLEKARIFTLYLGKVEGVADYDMGETDSDETEVAEWDLDSSSDSDADSDSPLTDSEDVSDYAIEHEQHAI